MSRHTDKPSSCPRKPLVKSNTTNNTDRVRKSGIHWNENVQIFQASSVENTQVDEMVHFEESSSAFDPGLMNDIASEQGCVYDDSGDFNYYDDEIDDNVKASFGKVVMGESRTASLSDMLNNFKIEDVDDEEADDQAPPTQMPTTSKEQGKKGYNLKTRRVASSRPGKDEGLSASMPSMRNGEKGSSKTNRAKGCNLKTGRVATSRPAGKEEGLSASMTSMRNGERGSPKTNRAKRGNLKTERVATSRPAKEEGFSASMSSIFNGEKGSSKTNRDKALSSSMSMFGAIAKNNRRTSSLGDSDKSLMVRQGNNSDKKDHAAGTISSIMYG